MGQLASNFFGRLLGSLPSNTETPNQAGRFGKEKCQVVTLRSGRNLTIYDPDLERKNPTSDRNTKNGTPRIVSNPFDIS